MSPQPPLNCTVESHAKRRGSATPLRNESDSNPRNGVKGSTRCRLCLPPSLPRSEPTSRGECSQQSAETGADRAERTAASRGQRKEGERAMQCPPLPTLHCTALHAHCPRRSASTQSRQCLTLPVRSDTVACVLLRSLPSLIDSPCILLLHSKRNTRSFSAHVRCRRRRDG